MNELRSTLRILIVDDEILQCKIITEQLHRLDFICESAPAENEALELLQSKDFDVVLLDLQLETASGLDILPKIKKLEDAPEVVILTGDTSLESGIAAMRDGAYDYLVKPVSAASLEVTLKKAAEKRRLVRRNLTLKDFVESQNPHRFDDSEILGESVAIRQIIEQAKAVARLNSTILITGESGTGKDVLARYIHHLSTRRNSNLITVNCGAMPETLFESEFFGYEKGSFSGAEQTKRGLIEAADGSTLFLDEIGEMPPGLQVKLLRFLENGEFRRIGSTRNLHSDVRLIAATNVDLNTAIKERKFRADLYYRLNVILFNLPPLRERTDDLTLLTDYFVDFYKRQFDKANLNLAPNARQKLENYSFPGNVRELKNIIERAVVLASGNTIESEQLVFHPASDKKEKISFGEETASNARLPISFETIFPTGSKIIELGELERQYILAVLSQMGGNREQAASMLGISERTLYRRLRDYE